MRRTSLAALVVALTWATAPATPARATNIDSNLAASPATQANGGGCYPVSIAPGLLDMLVLINPEWAPIVSGQTVDYYLPTCKLKFADS